MRTVLKRIDECNRTFDYDYVVVLHDRSDFESPTNQNNSWEIVNRVLSKPTGDLNDKLILMHYEFSEYDTKDTDSNSNIMTITVALKKDVKKAITHQIKSLLNLFSIAQKKSLFIVISPDYEFENNYNSLNSSDFAIIRNETGLITIDSVTYETASWNTIREELLRSLNSPITAPFLSDSESVPSSDEMKTSCPPGLGVKCTPALFLFLRLFQFNSLQRWMKRMYPSCQLQLAAKSMIEISGTPLDQIRSELERQLSRIQQYQLYIPGKVTPLEYSELNDFCFRHKVCVMRSKSILHDSLELTLVFMSRNQQGKNKVLDYIRQKLKLGSSEIPIRESAAYSLDQFQQLVGDMGYLLTIASD